VETNPSMQTDQKCNLCNAPLLIKKGRYGNFLGCSRFPECKNIVSLKEKSSSVETNPSMQTDQKCNLCNEIG
ncbi:MAG: topoisomerase DNA-binding C4 zinc finger domain-containing protein, partial ['Prunus persica' phytoplasma PP2]|nr:topoisomerase DNA-binding C4 zinc finger domain-containing protein ['Prunus persica' phytoplasma PP2]